MNGKMNKRKINNYFTCLKILMGVGIFLQDCWDQMCSQTLQASRMSRTPSFLFVAVISLSGHGMQRWWWLELPGPG
jgi:hypothetical protein